MSFFNIAENDMMSKKMFNKLGLYGYQMKDAYSK